MVFPESERVVYQRNTLAEVICQLRFPPVLRIDSDIPADFQDRIRDEYPLLRDRQSQLPSQIPAELAKLVAAELPGFGRSYDFLSEDSEWKVGLTKNFLSLSTTSYQRWEDFKSKLEGPQDALLKEYRPSFFSRLGLRYRNVISRSKLDLSQAEWSELLANWLLGELGREELAGRIEAAAREVVVVLDDSQSKVRIKHGLAKDAESGEVLYVIDADYFTDERTETTDAVAILDRFNRESGRLFRWCITRRLHEAMGPTPVG